MAYSLGVMLLGVTVLGTTNLQCVQGEEQADQTQPVNLNMNLGANVLKGGGKDVVYLGDGGNASFDWRVLAVNQEEGSSPVATVMSNSGLLMGTDTLELLAMPWSNGGAVNAGQNNYFDWSGSDMENWLNGDDFYGNASVFQTPEKSMLLPISSYTGDADLSILNDYFYLPYSDDVTNVAYGFTTDESRKLASGAPYWLRNQGSITSGSVAGGTANATAYVVNSDGTVQETENAAVKKDGSSYGVAPITNLDLGKVLFTKQALLSWDETFTVPIPAAQHNWELTLEDEQQSITPLAPSLKIDGMYAEEMPVLMEGQSIELMYKYHCDEEASTRKANKVSLLITKGDYKTGSIISYAQLPMVLDETNKGVVNFVIPDGFDGTQDQIYILAEQIQDPYEGLPPEVITAGEMCGKASVEYASTPVNILQQAEAPTAAPAPLADGKAYPEGQTVTLTSATPGAEIYYTTDGREPRVDEGLLYTAPILVTEDMEIKAIAVADDQFESDIAVFSYLIGETNITELKLTPSSGEMARGDILPFLATMNGDHIRDYSLTWTMTGNTSSETKLIQGIGDTAILYTGVDETSTRLNVTVASVAEPSKTASAVITVSDKYVVTVEAVKNGTVSVNKTRAQAGTDIIITAVPNSGYKLQNILVDGNVISGNTFKMPARGVRVSASFVAGSGSQGSGTGSAGGSPGSESTGSAGGAGGTGLKSSAGLASSKALASKSGTANTGDTQKIFLWAGVAVAAVLGCGSASVMIRKKRKTDK